MLNFLTFVIILSILIIVHEFGHFIVARRSGVKVERFSIGFGPILFKRKGKETDFLICLFPLGGYVKMAGDSRPDFHGLGYEFLAKPVKTKIKIVFAGPLFNYIFAFVLFWCIAVIGFPYAEPVVGKLKDGYPAEVAGVQENDRILSVNDKNVEYWTDMTKLIRKSKEKVSLRIERNGKIILLSVPLTNTELGDEFGRKKMVSVIGIEPSFSVKIVKYGFFRGFLKAIDELFSLTFMIIQGFILMILGVLPVKEAVAGPLGIYYITSEAMKVGIVAILHLMAVLNVSLAIINLVPLPLFDGGHIFIFLLEKIRKRPISDESEERLTRLGYVIIIVLVLFVFYNDVLKFGSKIWGK
ncbi:MAG: RIP metalloprotease RseP [Candidatus Omnitrophota bacterium]|nr:RIP metalloprotease RseP [Candidatus Omnitrophota bacterium]